MSGFKQFKEQQDSLRAKEKLLEQAKKKITTTMIGALSDLESLAADYLAAHPEIHEQLRSNILDRGNNQLRNLEIDFSYFDITIKKHTFILPVTQKKD